MVIRGQRVIEKRRVIKENLTEVLKSICMV